jgi:hypothetical protein
VNERQRELLAEADAAETTDPTMGPLIVFARRLLRERDLAGCYFPHQHFALVLTRSPPEEMDYKARLTISSAGVGPAGELNHICLELKVAKEIAPVLRWITETAICSPDRAMAEFDRLYERLLNAERIRPSGDEV